MSHHHRICVIDDDQAVRDSMRILLESHGFEVFDYPSAAAYLQNPPQSCVVIADIGMAPISGLDLIEVLRKASISTPAIILADIIEPRLAQRLAAATPCIRMTKPINPAELLKAIKHSHVAIV